MITFVEDLGGIHFAPKWHRCFYVYCVLYDHALLDAGVLPLLQPRNWTEQDAVLCIAQAS